MNYFSETPQPAAGTVGKEDASRSVDTISSTDVIRNVPNKMPDDKNCKITLTQELDIDALYARLAPRVLAFIRSIVGERFTAEDLLQQTFLKVHEARGQFIPGANPIPWVFTIARRTCLDELRGWDWP